MNEHPDQYYSRRNLNFVLFEVHEVLTLTSHDYFSAHHADTFEMILSSAESIADKILRPAFAESDKVQPELINGKLKVHPALHSYYKAFCESGLMTAGLDEAYGGIQLPKIIFSAADFIIGNAHNSFEMFTALSHHAARLIISFGSEEQISEYVKPVLNGEATATMCLTETGAGSSLSDITTTATKQADGSFRIKGQKIFISAGDHDITENIIHLVLARTSGAPKGTKGISLFIVPKKRATGDGWVDNDVVSVGVYHKMGQRATPAMHLEFGSRNDCVGWLIGEEGKGLSYMFQMMNTARLGVGLAGTYIASSAYYVSLRYARERPQGRRANDKNVAHPPVTIIHHPDVRRMLFFQKAFVEGSLSFILQCNLYLDLLKVSKPEDRQRYEELLELLTPVAKTWGAEMGINSVNQGLQVLGGYGYTTDFMLEQLSRDVRIMSLYEGTTGIQSQALLGRQVPANEGRALAYWKEEVLKDISRAKRVDTLETYADKLVEEIIGLEYVTKHLLTLAAKTDTEIFLSDANLYMELFGLINIAWQWLKQSAVAAEKLELAETVSGDRLFYQSKIETMQFFFHYELVKTKSLRTRLTDEKQLTIWKQDDPLI